MCWIFGYGSLTWRPGFAHAARAVAHLPGQARRFWQGSTDHRGTPGAPGRVVTLVPDPAARCTGVAYGLDPAEAASVVAALDHRERGGYARLEVEIVLAAPAAQDSLPRAGASAARPANAPTPRTVRALTWVATPRNPSYLGPAPLAEIAAVVRRARGPSGTNLEYALRLAEFVRAHDAEDAHVLALEALLRDSEPR